MTKGTMNGVGSFRGLPVEDPESLVDVEVPVPELRPRDVLVRVSAVSVNPADVKARADLAPSEQPRVLGFDAAGTVEALGPEVTTLSVGDEVWYAGDFNRAGSNADYQAVDERIVGRRPTSLSYAEAAALPLTTITAWESLFERFELSEDSRGTLLIIGGGGGVGSIMIQLAKELTGLTVLATAGSPESSAWVRELGADHVVNHHDLVATVKQVAPGGVEYVFSLHSDGNIESFAEIMRPFGHITAIDEPEHLDLLPLKVKCIAWHWELMFTRSMLQTPDMIEQKKLLERAAALVDDKRVRTTVTTTIEDFSAAGLREAHRLVESGGRVGKVVVTH